VRGEKEKGTCTTDSSWKAFFGKKNLEKKGCFMRGETPRAAPGRQSKREKSRRARRAKEIKIQRGASSRTELEVHGSGKAKTAVAVVGRNRGSGGGKLRHAAGGRSLKSLKKKEKGKIFTLSALKTELQVEEGAPYTSPRRVARTKTFRKTRNQEKEPPSSTNDHLCKERKGSTGGKGHKRFWGSSREKLPYLNGDISTRSGASFSDAQGEEKGESFQESPKEEGESIEGEAVYSSSNIPQYGKTGRKGRRGSLVGSLARRGTVGKGTDKLGASGMVLRREGEGKAAGW